MLLVHNRLFMLISLNICIPYYDHTEKFERFSGICGVVTD